MCSDTKTDVAGLLTKHQSSAAIIIVDLTTTKQSPGLSQRTPSKIPVSDGEIKQRTWTINRDCKTPCSQREKLFY